MIDLNAVRITAHRHNITRFQRLLRTELNEPDRRFVRSHLAEEKASLAEPVKRGVGALGPAEGTRGDLARRSRAVDAIDSVR
jgi:hypothetical protein